MRRSLLRTSVASAKAEPTPNLSIESMNIDQILTGRTVLSVEEEIVALQEADALQEQVTQDVAETARVEDVTDTMLNVAETVETVQEVTPAQAMLIDTVSEMAVAGTDGNPDDVIESAAPLIEAEDKALAIEAFVEDIRKRAAEIWERIRKFCMEIWATIKAFFQRIFSAAPRLLNRIKVLREAVTEAKKGSGERKTAGGVTGFSQGSHDTITIAVGANAISYPDYQVRDTKELLKGLGELKTLASYANGQYLREAKYMGEGVAAELKKFDPKKASEHLKAVASGLQKNNFTNVPANPPTGYLGCFEVHTTRLDKAKTKDLTDGQIVAALRYSGVKLQGRAGKGSMVNIKNQFATQNFAEMEQTLKAVEDLVKQLVAAENSADMKAIEKARADLLEGGNHASAAVGKLQGNDDAGKMERAYAVDVMKALMNFNTSLTRWMSELTMPVSKKVYQTSRVALLVVEHSLNTYVKGNKAAAA